METEPISIEDWTAEDIAAHANDLPPAVTVMPGVDPHISQDPHLYDQEQLLAAAAVASGTAAAMITAARGLLGTTEHPPGSNHNAVTAWYGFDGPWCDMGISLEGERSGNRSAVGRFALTTAHALWFRARGQWAYGAGDIQEGDVVFFSWSRGRTISSIDHVELVENAKLGAGRRATIGCNVGDACRREIRDDTFIVGRGRPAYAGHTTNPVPTTQEDPMPEYLSVERKAAEAGGAGERALHFDVTHEDTKKLRDTHKATPGICDGGKNGAFFTATVDVAAATGGRARLVEVDGSKGWEVTKAYGWHPLGESFTEAGCVSAGQHLWVHVEAADGVTGTAKVIYRDR